MNGTVEVLLNSSANNFTLTSKPGSNYEVSGTGEFKANEFIWNNKLRNGIVFNCNISNGDYTYNVQDTLVLRDRTVIMEVYEPIVFDN